MQANAGTRPLGGALSDLVQALAGFAVQALVIFGSPVRVLRPLPPAVA